jgi:Fe-S-cluster-containing dehydrogenase component
MVIDLKRCIGCYTCVVACKTEHVLPRGIFWGRLLQWELGKYPEATRRWLPMLCMNCKDPACLKVCPTGATEQRADGIVTVDANKCFGCRYCMMACPYQARRFISKTNGYFSEFGLTPFERLGLESHQTGVVEKCNFCVDRVEKGQQPACVLHCVTKARYFGDLDDPNSEVSKLIAKRSGFQLRPECGTNPSVYYLPSG